jgi:hypothetical protein
MSMLLAKLVLATPKPIQPHTKHTGPSDMRVVQVPFRIPFRNGIRNYVAGPGFGMGEAQLNTRQAEHTGPSEMHTKTRVEQQLMQSLATRRNSDPKSSRYGLDRAFWKKNKSNSHGKN